LMEPAMSTIVRCARRRGHPFATLVRVAMSSSMDFARARPAFQASNTTSRITHAKIRSARSITAVCVRTRVLKSVIAARTTTSSMLVANVSMQPAMILIAAYVTHLALLGA